MNRNLKFASIGVASIIVGSLLINYFMSPDLAKEDSLDIAKFPPTFDQQIRSFQTGNVLANSILAECGTLENCLVDKLVKLSENEERPMVLEAFSGISAAYNHVGHYCHPQGHHLGMFLYEYTGDPTLALLAADRTCGASIYHGIMENYFKIQTLVENKSPDDIFAAQICDKIRQGPYDQFSIDCAHGTGHGLAISYNYDIFSASKRCDEFDVIVDAQACAKGVFMENTVEYFKTRGGSFDQDDIFYPCNKLDEKYAADCYHYQSYYILGKTAPSKERAFEKCDMIEPEKFARYCYFGIGFNWIARYLENPQKVEELCPLANDENQKYCYMGTLIAVADQKGTEHAFSFCKMIPEKFKADCFDLLGKWIHTIYHEDDKIEQECEMANSKKYSLICREADPKQLWRF